GGNVRLMTGAPQRIAIIRGAPILPDDRVVDWLAALAVPDNGGFALIGYAEAGDVLRGDAGFCHDRPHRCDDCPPYLLRVVLDLAWRRIDLTELHLRSRKRSQSRVECDCARRSRALIDCNESGRQMKSPRSSTRGHGRLSAQ